MRTECSRNCWIAGGIAGLLVWLSIGAVGSAGWAAGLFLGLITAWFLGGMLVWGVCQGAGNRADNEALLASGWPDAPFIPSRRVVRAGGELVSEEPLALADRIPGGAPLDSRTVTAMQGGDAGSRGGGPVQGVGGQSSAGARDGAASERPRIVAGAGPDAPVRRDGASPEDADAPDGGASRPDPAPDARAAPADEAGAHTGDPALIQPAPGVEAQVAHPSVTPVEGMEPEKPKVRVSDSEAAAMDATGYVEPRADSETGSDPRAPEGGIAPLVTGGNAAPPEGRAAGEQATGEARESVGARAEGQDASGTSAAGEAAAAEDGDAATGADDLTRIRGIGPMLQTWLAGYGVTRVEQIAEWDDADIARFAGMMGRQGHRIRDEDWVGQARLLAAGGETAHSHTVDTGEAG